MSRQKKRTKKTIKNKPAYITNRERRKKAQASVQHTEVVVFRRTKAPAFSTKLQLQVLDADQECSGMPRMQSRATRYCSKVAKHIPWNAVLKFASSSIRSDRDIVMEAVKKDGGALKYASETLRNDRAIVMEAVKKSSSVLQFASETLRDDVKSSWRPSKSSGCWNMRLIS